MHTSSNLSVALALQLVLSLSLHGQASPSMAPSIRASSKRGSACRFPFPDVAVRDDPFIKRTYDRFHQQTTIRYTAKRSSSMGLLILTFSYSGDSLRSLPRRVLLLVAYPDGVEQYMGGTEATFLLDSHPWKKGSVTESRLDYRSALEIVGTLYQNVRGIAITDCDLLAIANSQVFEGRIGSLEFKVADDDMDRLRDFAKRTNPALGEFIRK